MEARFKLELAIQPFIVGTHVNSAELQKRIFVLMERGRVPRSMSLTEFLGCDPQITVDGGSYDTARGSVTVEFEGRMQSLLEAQPAVDRQAVLAAVEGEYPEIVWKVKVALGLEK